MVHVKSDAVRLRRFVGNDPPPLRGSERKPSRGRDFRPRPSRCSEGRRQVQPRAGASPSEGFSDQTSADAVLATQLGVIFGVEGVLVQTETIRKRALSQLFLNLHGVTVSDSEFALFNVESERRLLQKIAQTRGIRSFDLEAALEQLSLLYKSGAGKQDLEFPGAKEVVQKCVSEGLAIGIASGTNKTSVVASLEGAGLSESTFDGIVTEEDVEFCAPSPETLLKTARLMRILPANCTAVVGSASGVIAAKSAGMQCVALASSDSERALRNAGADVVCESISEISVQSLKDRLRTGQLGFVVKSKQGGVQGWLREPVQFPGNWRTDRRSILQFGNLGLATTCVYLLYSRSKALSFISPRSFVDALNPFEKGTGASAAASDRIEAFKRYIADVEKRGGGKEVRDFPSNQDWFNAPPLSLRRDLDGKMIILDFWTYCCINCMHVLPDLAYIEQRFADAPVAVVGVHSAKFDNEKDSDAIRNAVLRYDIDHPIVNDRNMVMWRDLGVSSWPTLIVLSPKGRVLFTLPGEGHRQDLNDLLTAGLEYYAPRGLLNEKTVPLAPEKLKDSRLLKSSLKFPGKLATDLSGDRLFISDSNNHRIVVTSLAGEYIEQIGGNGARLQDGSYETCCFKRPQGVCFDAASNSLFVADTENHAVRQIDLSERAVSTLAGNGYQGRDYKGGARGRLQQLSSPWDLQMGPSGFDLYVAMAGLHQIWKYDRQSQVMAAFSGNGYESNKNGDNAQTTSWAQPSGLSLIPDDNNHMIVADSESSSLRKLDLTSGGSSPVAGGDPLFAENLFRFGDRDGKFSEALLQHPLGVIAIGGNQVLLADTYNHRIKLCDLDSESVTSVAGSGAAGYTDGSSKVSRLAEPSGFARGPENLVYIADTNNGLIRALNTESKRLSTLELKGIPPPRVSPLEADDESDSSVPSKVVVGDVVEKRNGIVNVDVDFSKGYGFTKGATSSFNARVVGAERQKIELRPERGVVATGRKPNVKLQYSAAENTPGGTKIHLDCKIYYCEEGKECLFENIRIEIPFSETLSSGTSDIYFSISPA